MSAASAATGSQGTLTLSLKGTQLVDAAGAVLGQLVGVEIDLHGEGGGGTYGGGGGRGAVDVAGDSSSEALTPQGVQGVPKSDGESQTSMLDDPVNEVWAHYEQVFPNSRRKLDKRRRAVISKALTYRNVDECKGAITALSQSDFHQGKNDRHTAYNDIEYALGKKSDSPDAVIDRWLERAGATGDRTPVQAKLANVPQNLKHLVTDKMQKVRLMYRSPSHQPTVEAGRRAVEELRRFPGIEPIDEDGRFKGWRVYG